MRVEVTDLPEVLRIKPRIFADERGFFMESWNQAAFDQALGRPVRFVQDNHSRSRCGVIRGLHFQIEPASQAKLVTVMNGRIFDVAVDVRKSSPSYGKWYGEELCGEERVSLWIPEGFAHGFLVLSDTADVVYKTTDFYSPEHERCIRWDDPTLAIEWPLCGGDYTVSEKDQKGILFGE